MLISFEKKFIFIHIPKTAGTTVKTVLDPYAHKSMQTSLRRLLSRLPVREDPRKAWFRTHDRANWVRRKMTREVFGEFYKFAVIRNPYDYAVSYFHYLRKNESSRRNRDARQWNFGEFMQYMERKNRINPVTQLSWICDPQGSIIVDQLIRFENLETDLRQLMVRLDIPVAAEIPLTNAGDRRHYRDYYGTTEREIAERLFRADLEKFGYEFDAG